MEMENLNSKDKKDDKFVIISHFTKKKASIILQKGNKNYH